MTREKEIEKFAESQIDCEYFDEDKYNGILLGAKWADETMINKAIKWIEENIDLIAMDTVSARGGCHKIVMIHDFEQKFRKAMKE